MAGSSSVLEAAPIGKQIFAHGISQRDPTAFWLVLDTYATRLLAQALSQELLLPMVISDRLHCRSPRSSEFLACGGGIMCLWGLTLALELQFRSFLRRTACPRMWRNL